MKAASAITGAGLAFMWAGYWAPWIAQRAAALNLNGYELAEWITFLSEVRDGRLRLSRLDFLIPLAAIAIATALWANEDAGLPTGVLWLGRVAALLGALALFPEYPFILTAHADPEFQAGLFLGLVTLAVVFGSLVIQSARKRWKTDFFLRLASLILSIVALGFTVRALIIVWPALAVLFHKSPQLNWGPIGLVMGAMLTVGTNVFSMWNRR